MINPTTVHPRQKALCRAYHHHACKCTAPRQFLAIHTRSLASANQDDREHPRSNGNRFLQPFHLLTGAAASTGYAADIPPRLDKVERILCVCGLHPDGSSTDVSLAPVDLCSIHMECKLTLALQPSTSVPSTAPESARRYRQNRRPAGERVSSQSLDDYGGPFYLSGIRLQCHSQSHRHRLGTYLIASTRSSSRASRSDNSRHRYVRAMNAKAHLKWRLVTFNVIPVVRTVVDRQLTALAFVRD